MKSKLSITLTAVLAANLAQAADLAMLDEVVVTAPHSQAPLTVSTDPKLPRQPVPAHDGADYLKTIPGFAVIRKGGTDGDPVLRGMAGSRLNLLLDGEQILGGCGQRMDPPTAYVFPAAYDRITVLKGPQTVIHGAGSSAGTVLFERLIDREKQQGVHGDVALTGGSYGRNDEVAEVRAGTEQAYVRAGATRSAADDYRDGDGKLVHAAYNRWSAHAALGWTPDDHTRLELTLGRSDGKAAYADRAMDGSKFARENYGLKFERKQMGGLLDAVEAQLFHNYVDHVMDNYTLRDFTATMMMPNPAVSNPDRRTDGLRALATLRPTESVQLKLGLDQQSNVHTQRTSMNQNMTPYETLARVQDAEFRNLGLFAELAQQAGEAGRVILGLRGDSWQATDARSMIMRGMSTVMNPTANQTRKETLPSGFVRYEQDVDLGTWYAGVGRTTRAPDYWELFSKESWDSASAFNTQSEKTSQLDIGMNYRAGEMMGSLSLFYSKVSDFILIQSNVNKGTMMMPVLVSVTRNIAATTWGGEAGLAYPLSETVKLDLSLAYVRGTNDTDGTALAQLPPLEGRFVAGYDDQTWSAGMLLRAVADQNEYVVNQGNIAGQDIGATPGFAVLSINGGWRAGKNLRLTAGVDNVFNRSYAEHLSRAGAMVAGYTQTTRVNEMGRSLWLKGNFEF